MTNPVHLYFVFFILHFKINISIFILLFRSALDQFLKIILNATLPIINHYNTNTSKTNIDASVSNNNKPLPLAFIGHECTWSIICTSYWSAKTNPQPHDTPSTNEVFALSAFLQTCTWPLCVRNDKCEKPTIVHQPDVCIVYVIHLHGCLCCHGDLCSLTLSEWASSWRIDLKIYWRLKLVPRSHNWQRLPKRVS